MGLVLHNTINRRVEPFEPRDPEHVRIYVCGPTVYDDAHIGNARPVVVFDLLVRLLRKLYPRVTYVRNVTDVDDKINQRAKEKGLDIREFTKTTLQRFGEDMANLNALPPDLEPRATEHIPEMVAMIGELLDRGHAYEAEGHVLFEVSTMSGYGRLSGHDREEQIAGARVEVASFKRDSADFVVWKPSEKEEPGWDSPWGRGRPGWHIECSAMSRCYLSPEFDIHGGGADLVFPHHENELAQSSAANPESGFARFWVHNGYLLTEGEKMAKSAGNFHTVRDLLADHPGESIRLTLLSTHYRQPIDFTLDSLMQSRRTLDRWRRCAGGAEPIGEVPVELLAALEDDLNTPKAMAVLHAFAASGNGPALLAGARAMGLLQVADEEWFRAQDREGPDHAEIQRKIDARTRARERCDFSEADRIRDGLLAVGIILEDGSGGTTWRRR